jgi:hypothetical protein
VPAVLHEKIRLELIMNPIKKPKTRAKRRTLEDSEIDLLSHTVCGICPAAL